MKYAIVRYSHPALISRKLSDYCLRKLTDMRDQVRIPLISTVAPADLKPCLLSLYQTLLIALSRAKADAVFLAEHDCVYPWEHFQIQLPDGVPGVYNTHVWTLDIDHAQPNCRRVLSGLLARRDALIEEVGHRIQKINQGQRIKWAEPWGEDARSVESTIPYLDLRHGKNLTGARKLILDAVPIGWTPEQICQVREHMKETDT